MKEPALTIYTGRRFIKKFHP